jgi:hypothetical protein
MDGVEYINGVPQVVFVCWFGFNEGCPEMSANRFNVLKKTLKLKNKI